MDEPKFYLVKVDRLDDVFKYLNLDNDDMPYISGSDYIYIGIDKDSDGEDIWTWMPLEDDEYEYFDELVDGADSYFFDGYTFCGYLYLDDDDIKKVEEFKEKVSIQNKCKTYNL